MQLSRRMVLSGGGFGLPFNDGFGRTDGALGYPWSTGATWAINTNKATNTPVAGAEDVSNGNMEAGDPPTDWTGYSSATLDSVADERTGGAGIASLSVANGAVAGGGVRQALDNVAGTYVKVSGWVKKVSGISSHFSLTSNFTQISYKSFSGADWTLVEYTGRLDALPYIGGGNYQTTLGNEFRFDDISVKPLVLTELINLLPSTIANVTCGDLVTLDDGYQGGVIINADSLTAPLNFILAYYSRSTGKAVLDKCVAGTYSNIINVTVAYVAGAEVKVIKSGDTYQLYYNSIQRGTDQVVANMNGRRHGLFLTGGATSSLDAFFCQ